MNWLNKLVSRNPAESLAACEPDALVIDVRSPAEFANGHVEGAINIPLDRFAESFSSVLPDKSKQIILYCQSGARSGQACQFLERQNYTNVLNGRNVSTVNQLLNRHPR